MIYIVYFLSIVLIVGIDQISKFLITLYLPIHEKKEIITNFFSLYHTRNTGVAFSMLEGKQSLLKIITIVALVIFLYLLLFDKKKTKVETCCLSMMTGGCIGNFIDRLRFEYVIDFFSFRFFGWDFAIFNVADIFLTVGALLYIVVLLRGLIYGKN